MSGVIKIEITETVDELKELLKLRVLHTFGDPRTGRSLRPKIARKKDFVSK
jgi:hypothetical protein